MYKHIRWLIPAVCIIAFIIKPCYAIELIISDSGRNTAWSYSLNIGDDFSVKGADDKPVGGIIPYTTAIHQALVPMPKKTEIEQMTQNAEKDWIKKLGDLLKDRVHIATTNGANIFEIRLLQDTPQSPAATIYWHENPRMDRFARMSYQAIGKLVEHLQERNEPVCITAALADSGCMAFAQAIDQWKPYTDIFRRVDMIDGRAYLTDIRLVISTLGGKRVRLFHTSDAPMAPAMTIGRREVAEVLLRSHPYLTEYTLTSIDPSVKDSDPYAQTPWMNSLSGLRMFTVKRRRYVDGKAIEQTLDDVLTGQDFRDPIAGLDLENRDLVNLHSLKQLGIIAPTYLDQIIPSFGSPTKLGATARKSVNLVVAIDQRFKEDTLGILSDAYKGRTGHKIVTVDPRFDPFIGWSGSNVYDALDSITKSKENVRTNIVCNGEAACTAAINGVSVYLERPSGSAIKAKDINIAMLNTTQGGRIDGGARYLTLKSASLLQQQGVKISALELRGTGKMRDFANISSLERAGIPTFYTRQTNTYSDGISLGKSGISLSKGRRASPNRVGEDIGASRWFTDSGNVKSVGTMNTSQLLYKVLNPSDHRVQESFPISQHNRNIIKTASPEINNIIAPRIRPGSTIILRGSTRLDKYAMNTFNQRSIKVTHDRLGIKDFKSGQRIVEIRSHEDQFKLGTVTNPQNFSKQDSMRAGLYESQERVFGDLPNLRDYKDQKSFSSITNFHRSSNWAPMSATFNDLQRTRFDSTDFGLMNNSKLLPISQDIGGVMLNTSAKVQGDGVALNTGNVSLIFQNSAGVIDFMKLQRFATALWATYLSVEGPGISIDPVSKSFKEHGDKHEVRYIGQVLNTELGKVMRETDHLMKHWAIGTHRPDISNFLSPDEIDKKLANKIVSNRASRFWFVPEDLTFKRSDNMLMFSSGRMTLQTEYLDDNPKGEKNEANELFAQWFTENYDLVAERYPIFRELFEYAQLVSLSTYLRENRVPMLWFLMANREIILTENSIDKVDQLVKKSDYRWYVKIYGGVELQLGEALRDESRYENDPALQDAENVLRDKSSDKTEANTPVVFSANDTSYTVASKNTLKLFNSSAEGDTIQTDMALFDKYHEEERRGDIADKKEWNLIAPRLELIRYYSPGLRTRAQFGDGWHLLVPFRLETETQTSLPGTGFIPKRIVIVNLLSGISEVLHLKGRDGVKLRYVPKESGGLTDNLVRNADGSWCLLDILGGEFIFDQEGDLRQMTLRKDHTAKFKLNSKKYNKRIPGYIVKYHYNIREVNGQDLKVLSSIKQGGHTARVDWHPSNTLLRIASIRVLLQGQVEPLEVLSYEYGQDGMLAQVTSQSGRNISVRYEDDNMRVVVLQR